jgi:uncharacterized membrane protein YbhN (UPF0104 family)
LRCAGFLLLLAGLASVVDLRAIQQHMLTLAWSSIAIMIALHIAIILLASWRFLIVARASGAQINITQSNSLTFGSTLANMVLPTGLAGDAGRVLLMRRFGLSLKSATTVGVFDRVIGLASLSVLVLLGHFAEPALIPTWGIVLVCGVTLGCIAALLAPNRIAAGAPKLGGLTSTDLGQVVPITAALSIAAHLISLVIASVFLWDQQADVSTAELLTLFPAVLLAASLPISIGGWGARETAAAVAFATIGLSAPVAIALAVAFGLTQLIAAGLGAATFWFIAKNHRGQT